MGWLGPGGPLDSVVVDGQKIQLVVEKRHWSVLNLRGVFGTAIIYSYAAPPTSSCSSSIIEFIEFLN